MVAQDFASRALLHLREGENRHGEPGSNQPASDEPHQFFFCNGSGLSIANERAYCERRHEKKSDLPLNMAEEVMANRAHSAGNDDHEQGGGSRDPRRDSKPNHHKRSLDKASANPKQS